MDGTINDIYVRQLGTYKVDGHQIHLNLSGKVEATSAKSSAAVEVNRINSNPAEPKQETLDIDWQSPNQFTITARQVVPAVVTTLDRKTS
jgi:hypothetical protein